MLLLRQVTLDDQVALEQCQQVQAAREVDYVMMYMCQTLVA